MTQTIKKEYNYEFEISREGIYTISIEASCKSGKVLGLFGGEDLRVEIDGIKLREMPAKNRAEYFNVPPAWNGTKLKGKTKTIIFILKLDEGRHSIKFIPNKGATINEKPVVLPFEVNILNNVQSDERDRQPWITIALINLPLNIFDVSATCEKRDYDSDDLKVIVNGEIQKNEQSGWWGRNWYFQGRQMKGLTREARFYPKLPEGVHYIEFWADRTPILNSVQINLDIEPGETSKEEFDPGIRVPNVDDPEWTGNFDDDTEQILFARAIFGEARQADFSDQLRIAVGWSIKNRISSPQWGNTYHEVILEDGQYSAFNKDDPNWPFVKDPLSGDHDAWQNCYKIAGQVMNGELDDPTDGANHYFSDFIDHPKWTKSPQAEFKIKIDNTLFYNLDWTRNGFSKLLLIFVLAVCLICAGLYYRTTASSGEENFEEIFKVESYNHYFINPKTEEIDKIELDENGRFLRVKEITNNGYRKTQLKRFSDSDALGYFQYLYKREDPGWNYCQDHIALMVMPDDQSEPYEVYRGDCHTSRWELVGYDNKHLKVYWNCGTGCKHVYVINSVTSEVESEHTEFNES